MAARAKYRKTFKQHLLRCQWPDFIIISQKCSSYGPLPKLLKWFHLVRQRGFFPCWCFTRSSFPVFFPCWSSTGVSFPTGASHDLLSLLMLHTIFFPGLLSLLELHRGFFPYWCFTRSSFPAGAPQGLLTLLMLLMVFFPGLLSLLELHRGFFPCWCFTQSSFPAGASQISYFKVLPWQPNKMATFNWYLSSQDTITSIGCLEFRGQSRAIWPSFSIVSIHFCLDTTQLFSFTLHLSKGLWVSVLV